LFVSRYNDDGVKIVALFCQRVFYQILQDCVLLKSEKEEKERGPKRPGSS
jgi:hypothetical protein